MSKKRPSTPLNSSSPIVKIRKSNNNSTLKRHSPLFYRPNFKRSPVVRQPLISSAEMNRRYQLKVDEDAYQLRMKKRDEIMKSINQNRLNKLYNTPEHKDAHDMEVNYNDIIAFQNRQRLFNDQMDEAAPSNGPIWFGGRKKRKLRKTKKKKQSKRKSRKSRK